MLKKVRSSIVYLFLFIAILLVFVAIWVKNTFGNVTFNEIIFHLMVPLQGSDVSFVFDFIKEALIPAIVIEIIVIVLNSLKYRNALVLDVNFRGKDFSINIYPFKKGMKIFLFLVLIISSMSFVIFKLDIGEYIKMEMTRSTFIEENYVDPKEANIVFPEKKRNLVYIFLESMEASYADVPSGGIIEANLIPNLTNVANENVSFSNTDKLGGAMETAYATWTIAAMVSYHTGVPLKLGIDDGSYSDYGAFLPGATTLGDILEENGYNNELMLGSMAFFSGRDKYFKHGNYKIFDWSYVVESGRKTVDDYVWWGLEDYDLFGYAKEEILKLSKEDKPFNVTLLTVDTHFEDGYLSPRCHVKYYNNYKDVISCSDNLVMEFLSWLKEQDFYDNTTIVLVGDHKTMDMDFFNEYDSNYLRTTYNAIINSAVSTDNKYNRQFMTYDMFPTVLASLGATYDGDRLAIGTNLFSNSKTLTEEYGFDYVTREISSKSDFYNNKLIYEKG